MSLVVKVVRNLALRDRGLVGCHSDSCCGASNCFSAYRAYRIVDDFRGHVRRVVWRLWPGIAGDCTLRFGYSLLCDAPDKFLCAEEQSVFSVNFVTPAPDPLFDSSALCHFPEFGATSGSRISSTLPR